MTRKERDVKRKSPAAVFLQWVDHHPRTGWYISLVLTLNFVLNLADALDVDLFWFTR